MKKLIVLILVLIASQNIFAQSGWLWQNPLPQGNDLLCTKFLNSKTGFAAGRKGVLMKTTNGGINWQQIDYNFDYKDIHFLAVTNANVIYLTGHTIGGLTINIYKSYNGGINWVKLPEIFTDITSLCFVDSNTGFITNYSNLIKKTTDGGMNWSIIYQGGPSSPIKDAYFINAQTGFFSRSEYPDYISYIVRTTNQGISWNPCFTLGSNGFYENFQFVNHNTGFVCQYNSGLIVTTNGGANWAQSGTLPTNMSVDKSLLKFVNHSTGYVGHYTNSSSIQFYKTTNTGITWNILTTLNLLEGRPFVTNYLCGKFMDFPTIDSGYFVNSGGYILKTTNFGINWNNQTSLWGNLGKLNQVKFVDENTGYVIGRGGTLLKTTNRGLNWNYSKIGNYSLNIMCFINNQIGYIGTDNSKLFKTTNGALSWDTIIVSQPLSNSNINSIYFFDNDTGFVTNGYFIYKTTNAGLNWMQSTSPFFGGPLHFINSDTGYGYFVNLVPPTQFSQIYKTINAGATWVQLYQINSSIISEVKFISNDVGYYVNTGQEVYKTLNGGTSWFKILNGDGNEIKVLYPNAIYSGSYKSTNAGLNWTLYNTKIQSINSIHFIDNNTGILVGGNGAGILRTTDGGEIISSVYSTQISPETPENFLLKQNYPNPFNPTTIISYQLTISSFVTLKLFDLLGKEVATLVNEKQNAGSYAVDFNSTEFNLPSGIYFYSLNAREFKETKKMVLVK